MLTKNYYSCWIATIFLSGLAYLKVFSNKNAIASNFQNSLPIELKQKYEAIVKERNNIYINGTIYGVIGAVMLLFIMKKKIGTNYICFVLVFSQVFSYIYYIMSSKSDYIILHLDNRKDRERWLEVYKHMHFNYHIGIVIGLFVVSILWYAL